VWSSDSVCAAKGTCTDYVRNNPSVRTPTSTSLALPPPATLTLTSCLMGAGVRGGLLAVQLHPRLSVGQLEKGSKRGECTFMRRIKQLFITPAPSTTRSREAFVLFRVSFFWADHHHRARLVFFEDSVALCEEGGCCFSCGDVYKEFARG
jgi:hypothetical protein